LSNFEKLLSSPYGENIQIEKWVFKNSAMRFLGLLRAPRVRMTETA